MGDVTLTPVDPTPDEVQYLEDRLYEFNSKAADIADGEMLAFFVREDGRIVAGICGNTWGGTCELRQFWVEDAQRHRGLGTRLFRAAEEEAQRRGCTQIVLMTFSFQAPAFYERHGFEIVATIDDHPRGHRNLLMRKRLHRQNVLIRPARPDEQLALEELQRRASLANPGDRDALLANPDAISLPVEQIADGCVFVAEHDGVVAGFAAVVPRPDGGAELDALFVEPAFWKHGIGRRLVDHVCAVARERKAGFLHVTGNPHAEGFYAACGFHTTGTLATRFGTGLQMRRPL